LSLGFITPLTYRFTLTFYGEENLKELTLQLKALTAWINTPELTYKKVVKMDEYGEDIDWDILQTKGGNEQLPLIAEQALPTDEQ
jgi:hypothetical protein